MWVLFRVLVWVGFSCCLLLVGWVGCGVLWWFGPVCLCFHFGFSLLFLVLICFICVISVCLTFAVFGLAGVIL